MKEIIKEIKQPLSPSKIPSIDFTMNPYQGCSHQCVYCYAETMGMNRENPDRWKDTIFIRENIADVLRYTPRLKDKTIVLSTVTDPYQKVEEKWELTRKILQKLSEFPVKVRILTKSDLVLRDIDILQTMERVEVGISISQLEEKISSILEPGAPSPEKRLEVLAKLKLSEIDTFVFCAPIFPWLTPIRELIDKIIPVSNYCFFDKMHLKGNWGSRISKVIKEIDPLLEKKYYELFVKKSRKDFWKLMGDKIRGYCDEREYECIMGF